MDLRYPLRPQCLQPGDFGVQVVGVNVQVQPARARTEPLDEQGGTSITILDSLL